MNKQAYYALDRRGRSNSVQYTYILVKINTSRYVMRNSNIVIKLPCRSHLRDVLSEEIVF